MKGKAVTVTAGKVAKVTGYAVKGVTYASAEAIVRGLGGTYSWNETTKTLTVAVGASASAGHNH